jgi:hypothetical protein
MKPTKKLVLNTRTRGRDDEFSSSNLAPVVTENGREITDPSQGQRRWNGHVPNRKIQVGGFLAGVADLSIVGRRGSRALCLKRGRADALASATF